MFFGSNKKCQYFVLVTLLLVIGCSDTPTQQEPATQAVENAGVYFSSNRSGNFEIYHLQEPQLTALTNDNNYDTWWPRQSPDGTTMLFYRSFVADRPATGGHNNNYDNASLWSLDLQTNEETELISKDENGWSAQGVADWSPDGTKLVMAALDASTDRWNLYITDAQGINPIKIPSNTLLPLDPSWSPDGSKIVYAAFPPDYIGLDKARLEIYSVNTDGSDPIRLTNDLLRDHDPYWSPDGSTIAFETDVDPNHFGIGRWALRKVDVESAAVDVILDDDHINTLPRWSADSNKLYFHRFEFGSGHGFIVASINADGSDYKEITSGGNYDDTDIDWFR